MLGFYQPLSELLLICLLLQLMYNVVNKHSICNLANCARYFQSLNHTVSRECVLYTLTLKPTDVHTNWSSRTHFASRCKKQAELKVNAGADNLTKTAVTGDDNVVCVFAHGFPQLHSIHEGPTSEVPDVAAALNPAWSPTPDLYPALTALAHLSTPLYSAYYTDMYMSIWRQTMRTHTRTLPH